MILTWLWISFDYTGDAFILIQWIVYKDCKVIKIYEKTY